MTSIRKRFRASILLVCILASTFLCSQLGTLAWFSPNQSNGVNNHVGGTLVSSAPLAEINITGNSELDAFSNKTGGDGTSWGEAYIIENFEITVADIDPCVKIQDTSRFLVIRNCTLTGPFSIVVRFDNCSNIRLEGSRVISSQFSSHGVLVNRSSNVLAIGNNFTDPSVGIGVHDSNNTSITGNRVTGTSSHAIQVNVSRSCIISGNDLTTFDEAGILVDDSSNLNISLNHVSSDTTTWGGIYVRSSTGCNITSNNVSGNSQLGIRIQDSTTGCRLSENNVTRNEGYGISISSSVVPLIASNNMSFNNLDGIYMWDGSSSIIQDNELSSNGGYGANINIWDQVLFTRNSLVKNTGHGCYFYQIDSSLITGNNASSNGLFGIDLYNCFGSGSVVSNNVIARNNGTGLYAYGSDKCNITQNTIEENDVGIQLSSTSSFRVSRNIIANNTNDGATLFQSGGNRFFLNLFEGNNPQASIQDYWDYNYFDNGTFGNYWSDYLDFNPEAESDGIFWNQFYPVGYSANDYFPLVTFFDPDTAGRITIDGNAELAAKADSGNGSSSNPYVIASKTINAYRIGSCISVRNTNLYLRIENCTLAYSGFNIDEAGVYLENATHITISGNNFTSCERGVYISHANDVNVIGSNITGGTGIYVHGSIGIKISGNWLNITNIQVLDSDSINVTGNSILHAPDSGIWLYGTNSSQVISNTVVNASSTGIDLHGNGIEITSNTITSLGEAGIRIRAGSINIQFDSNTLVQCGFYFETSVSAELATMTLLTSNMVNERPVYYYYNLHVAGLMPTPMAGQIILVGCSNAFLQYNTLVNCTIGIALYFCSFVTLFHNNASGNARFGIYIFESDNVNVSENTLEHNAQYGIFIDSSIHCTIARNEVRWNVEYGICLESSEGNMLFGNNVTYNNYDNIYMYGSDGNDINGNDLSYAGVGMDQGSGIRMRSCNGNTIANNNFSFDDDSGIYTSDSTTHLVITGNTFNGTSTAIYISSSNDVVVDVNSFFDYSYACDLHYTNRCNITRNSFTNSNSNSRPIRFTDYCNYMQIEYNSLPAGTEYPIMIYNGMYSIVRHNRGLVNDRYGIYMYNHQNSIVLNNTITTPLSMGIYLSQCTNITLIENDVLGSHGHGIQIDGCTRVNITSSLLNNSAYMGIRVESSSTVTLSHNAIRGSTQDGIYLNDAAEAVLDGNNITFSLSNGINVASSDDLSIIGNIVTNNTNQGIRMITCNSATISDNYVSGSAFGGINVDGNLNLVFHNFVDYERDIYTTSNNQVYENFYLLEDTDGDGLLGREEYALGTNPVSIDTDNDNFLDGYEVDVGADPCDPLDTPVLSPTQYDAITAMAGNNADLINIVFAFVKGNWTYLQASRAQIVANMTTIESLLYLLDDTLADRDSDGMADVYEIGNGTNPQIADSDLDNLGDALEVKIGTNPLDDDSDGDGYMDGAEFAAGTDPLDETEYPGMVQGTNPSPQPTTDAVATTIAAIALGIAVFAVVALILVIKKKPGSRAKNLPRR